MDAIEEIQKIIKDNTEYWPHTYGEYSTISDWNLVRVNELLDSLK